MTPLKKILLFVSIVLIQFLIQFNHVLALDLSHFTITRVTAPYFVDDQNGNNLINRAYVGFEVTNKSSSGYYLFQWKIQHQ